MTSGSRGSARRAARMRAGSRERRRASAARTGSAVVRGGGGTTGPPAARARCTLARSKPARLSTAVKSDSEYSAACSRSLGAAREPALERGHVAAVQAAGDAELDERRHERRGVDGGERPRRRHPGQREHHDRPDRLAEAVPAHVDHRLDRALGGLGQRRVEQLVPGAEDRAADADVGAARQDAAPRAGKDEAERTGDRNPRGVDRHRAREAEPGEHGAAERRLDEERDERRARVEQAEEADERLALREVRDRLGLEGVVGQARDRRRQQDHEREVPQVGVAPDLRPRCRRFGLGRALRAAWRARHAPPPPRRPPPAKPTSASRTSSARGGGEHRDALGPDAAQEPAERGGPRHPRQQRLRGVRVEALVEQRPERGDPDRAQHRPVQVEQSRRQPRQGDRAAPTRRGTARHRA